MSCNKANQNANKVGGTSMICMPSESTPEFSYITTQTKIQVALTGSAATETNVPTIGLVDIFESDESYLFRVSLPGVSKDNFSCEIELNGKILIKGVTTTGEKIMCKHNQVFKMLSQNLCPRGPFTISFQLPGLVHNDDTKSTIMLNGVLVGTVKKLNFGY